MWASVLQELRRLFPLHACKEFRSTFPLFGFREDQVGSERTGCDSLV